VKVGALEEAAGREETQAEAVPEVGAGELVVRLVGEATMAAQQVELAVEVMGLGRSRSPCRV
jgi:hypothetical protein